MTKLKILFIAAIVLAVAVSVMIQRRSEAKLLSGAAALQEQSNQLSALTAEHERLSNVFASATNARSHIDHAAELERLRSEAEALKKQTNQLGKSAATIPPPTSLSSSPPIPDDRTLDEKRRQASSARNLGTAFIMYGMEHQNLAPSSLDQMAAYLAKMNLPASEANQFEIIYQGSLDKLRGIPPSSVAVVRSQQTWQGPDGKLSRVYGFLDGHGEMIGSVDNFQSYEALHVISQPQAGQAGQ